MKKNHSPKIEVADIFNKYSHLLKKLPMKHHKVIQAIKNCRTSALGGHRLSCDSCDFKKNAYNSCRDRHCPKCGFTARTRWIENRTEELLDCQYFHVVFTVPKELRQLILYNQKVSYNILFKASSETLKEVAANPDRLNADIGCIGVLHTWGQNLIDHPHIHFIVPGGGLSKDKSQWVSSKEDFLLPVKVLSKVFRAKVLDYFEEAFDKGQLIFKGAIEYLGCYSNFKPLMRGCSGNGFLVYSKKPFAGPQQVINYLGQYTHRIAISNYRLIKVENERVYFTVRDNKNPGKKKVMSLHLAEFMRRFLMHVLPQGYVRIRHFGILGNRAKKIKIALIRKLQGLSELLRTKAIETWEDLLRRKYDIDPKRCPDCKKGVLSQTHLFLSMLNSA